MAASGCYGWKMAKDMDIAPPAPVGDTPCAADAGGLSARAERKCAQLLDGAQAVILARGFEGASVDDIAREAGISKATMYRYYPDKAALFAAVMRRDCGRQSESLLCTAAEDGPLEPLLVDFAIRFTTFVLTPTALGTFRNAAAESERFPAIGEAFFTSGIDRGRAKLAPILAAASARGEIAVDDADLAAHRFFGLCLARVFYNRLFGIVPGYDAAEIAEHARGAVAAFLRMYRPEPRGDAAGAP